MEERNPPEAVAQHTLATYAYPTIGESMWRGSTVPPCSACLSHLGTGAETARRLRGRIETILDFAAAKGWRDLVNPARWRDLRRELPAPKKVKPLTNQPALPWQQLPAFTADLQLARRSSRPRP